MLHNIPEELRRLTQWVVWKYITLPTGKATKVPYSVITGEQARVNHPSDWCSFDQAVQAMGAYQGVGFVLSENDPYGFIDLDQPKRKTTENDQEFAERVAEVQATQLAIYNSFQSYSERSPSGTGCHIIIRGKVTVGRKRESVEIYSQLRYMTMTGDVVRNLPIADYQQLLVQLHADMGFSEVENEFSTNYDAPERESDFDIVQRAANASNGTMFLDLYHGKWTTHYPSQSEADLALINILAFYTQNRNQITRIFHASALGQREKAKRYAYMRHNINMAFDNVIPEINLDSIRNGGQIAPVGDADDLQTASAPLAEAGPPAVAPVLTTALPPVASPTPSMEYPPGLVGEIAQFVWDQSPRQVREFGLVAALGLMSGICGRAFNTYTGAGLNQYIVLLAKTGAGKESIATGITRLMGAVSKVMPTATDFLGPASMSSEQAIHRTLSKKPCFVSVFGEMGMILQQLTDTRGGPVGGGIKKALLDLYNKSGVGQMYQGTSYSDKDKNISAIASPSVTLIGESTPTTWYKCLDDEMITDGFLPRWTVIEYTGKREYLNQNVNVVPNDDLVKRVGMLCSQAQSIMHAGHVCKVDITPDAKLLLDQFETHTTDLINHGSDETTRNLWNRAHIKALKLASIVAVGINMFAPVIDYQTALWARDFAHREVQCMLAKFERSEVGSSEMPSQQVRHMRETLMDYVRDPDKWVRSYGVSLKMREFGILDISALYRRLAIVSCFRKDQFGSAHKAIDKTVEIMINSGILRAVDKHQAERDFGKSGKIYRVNREELGI